MNDGYRGLPIKARTEANVRESLKDHDPETVNSFVRLWAYAKENDLGLTRMSDQCGISSGVLSPAFNGTYNGDFSEIAKRINTFFWRLEQKAQYGGLREFVPTRLAKALWTVFEKTRVIRRIQIVQGPEQVGKTRAAEEYTERNNSGRTVLVSLPGGTKYGCQDFVWTLAQRLNIATSIKLREKRVRIREALEPCDLLLIDEAHIMETWTDASRGEFWDYLRTDIFNNGERGVVLMATNSDVLKGLHAWRKRAHYNIGQLLGRMRNEVHIIDPAEDIVEEDVEALVKRYYEPGARTLGKLWTIATRPQLGHFGLVQDVMNEAWTRAKSSKRKLCDDIVNETADRIMDTLKARKEMYE